MSIFPYVYYMVQSFKITESEGEISMYAGMVTSAFAFAECFSGYFWGRLSDRVGRKKVLLGGLFGTGLSMLLFGFATNLPMALIARALGGLLNGNIGVLSTTVAELVTVKEHQPRAFSIMPFVWCVGTIIGSSLGGLLANPADSWGSVFSGTIFEAYPYLLPNLVCTAIVVCGLTIGILFLEETHEDIKYRRDRGREVGQWILRKLWNQSYPPLTEKAESFDEVLSMLRESPPHDYDSACSSPTLCGARTPIEGLPEPLEKELDATFNVRSAFTKQICLIIVGVGILAFHTISLEQLIPILMSHPESTEAPKLPFRFQGGFGYSTQTIGTILAVQGALQMVAQLVLFPWISKRLGSLRTFWLTIALYPFLYLLAPYLALLPKQFRIPGIILLLVWKVTAQSLSYPSLNIMLTNASPSKKVLGTLNGAYASSASVCRGFGPTVSGAIATLGDSHGISGLAWWACAGIAMIAWIPGFFMEERRPEVWLGGHVDDEEYAYAACLADDDSSDAGSIETLSPLATVEVLPK
ncbi:MFS general substrate transporter [Westerdykella ornata]|uniref:MFS general substrate transporter n=1 Tax=Westerdykella ornata TaxID=318751 RepID=A0A6A6JMD2_WESOR|nr:MFS general substrate transporter [Westerdykella ornata]KAF2277108.1 MFS general substrate transporter [Westerdykella ornata]